MALKPISLMPLRIHHGDSMIPYCSYFCWGGTWMTSVDDERGLDYDEAVDGSEMRLTT